MLPKPLPVQLRIGVDICHVSRIQKIIGKLSETAGLERWASKIFNSHEWPELSLKTEQWKRNSNCLYSLDIFSKWLAGRYESMSMCIYGS
jgi:phosphopantetheinyl transferase (holo-ACP synthase)